jgi:hypothetical protein
MKQVYIWEKRKVHEVIGWIAIVIVAIVGIMVDFGGFG